MLLQSAVTGTRNTLIESRIGSTYLLPSLERILQYIEVEKEAEPKEGGTPPAYWPASGKLEVQNLTARYSPVSYPSKHHLICDSHCCLGRTYCPEGCYLQCHSRRAGRRWSVTLPCYSQRSLTPSTVGRTGSGKSTLTLSLLRCIHTEGTVVYDGIPTHTLNLDALRSHVTIIPQVVRAHAP